MFALYTNAIETYLFDYVNLLGESLPFFLKRATIIQQPNKITSFDGCFSNCIVVGNIFPNQFSFIKHLQSLGYLCNAAMEKL